MTPTLTLCLPTYNRAALLGLSLRAVLAQITPEMAPALEVLVLDNASPDGTPDVVAQAQAEFPHAPICYLRRPENIGADANFTDALTRARGEFLYLLSDDDILLPGAVTCLLGLIGGHPDLDAFALNVSHFTETLEDQNTQVGFPFNEDRIVRDRDQALLLFSSHITFLSSMAFRRTLLTGRDYQDKIGTTLIQGFFFLDVLASGRGVYITSRRYLANRQDISGGYNVFQVLITNFHGLMQYAQRAGFAPATTRSILGHHLHNMYGLVVLLKGQGPGAPQPDYREGALRALRVWGPDRFLLLHLIPRLLAPDALFVSLRRLRGTAAAPDQAGRGRGDS